MLLFFMVIISLSQTRCGSLGAFEQIEFSVSKEKMDLAIEKLFIEYPEYKIPEEWIKFDDWSKRGYDFLDGKIFYFKSEPQELYYISYFTTEQSNSKKPTLKLAIRAINSGNERWLLSEDLSEREIKRIETRFRSEIIPKLEKYTQSKSK